MANDLLHQYIWLNPSSEIVQGETELYLVNHDTKEQYIPYERWDVLLKEASENGCKFLNIAGGDPSFR